MILTAQLEAFVIGHEEQAVFAFENSGDLDGPSQSKAVLVPLKWRFPRRIAGESIRAGVQGVVAEKLEYGAVVCVGSAFGRDVDLAGLVPELRGVGSRLYLEFLQRIDGR